MEAVAKRDEREHNARVWLAWHIAAFHRMKKLPELKKLLSTQTSRPRQSWRQQLVIMAEWAAAQQAAKKQLKDLKDGR
jgi:hypothetical protein